MSTPQNLSLLYFGKVPSRGDFVRSTQQVSLVQTFDRWLSGALELMAVDARWKELYDRAHPFHFAVLGPRHSHVVAGHVRPSSDASGRRFPFMVASSFEVQAPEHFMARAPMALSRLWSQAEHWARRAQTEVDATPVLTEIGQVRVAINAAPEAYDAAATDFLDLQTLGSAQAMLARAHPEVDLARVVMGLGLLLQPVPASGSQRLEKGLRLPLPADPLYQPFVVSWWLDLVVRFLVRADFEVLVLLPQGQAAPMLSIGFAGGSALALADLLGRQEPDAAFVNLINPEWADDPSAQDYGVKKLRTYLAQQGLSLRQATQTFREAFLGE
ncbi:MAG: type VI secretion system-associated protein TagF [Burkholderiales bacterium]